MKNCTFPWTGMVINPQGYITLCCVHSSRNRFLNNHISEIDNLFNFFNGKEYEAARSKFKDIDWRNIQECSVCKLKVERGVLSSYEISQQFDPSTNKLQYLEFTTSNVCNQMCVTCGSQFSNQWTPAMEIQFGRTADKRHILTDNDVNKICESLTDLKELNIKGGEPFADIRNYKVIKKLFEVNNECKVVIITNGSLIPERYMDIIFRNPKRFQITASIDAIGKRYEWIRSTPWEKTDNTLKELYYQTGIQADINPVLSIYNAAHLSDISNWIKESEYIKDYDKCSNQVHYPRWSNVEYVFTQEQLDSIQKPFPLQSKFNEKDYKDSVKYTKVMNKIRGFDMDIWGDMG
jgi:molybdenum cofactor biosynthesis enzyme MoaA